MPVNDVSGDQSQCAAQISIWSHLGSDDLFRLLTNVIGPKIFVSGPMTVKREVMGLRAANHMTE